MPIDRREPAARRFPAARLAVGRARRRILLVALAIAPMLAAGSLAASPGEGVDACVEPPDDLVSWWRAENDADDETGANPGDDDAVDYAPGPVGQAFSFDGDGDQVVVADDPSLNLQAFTVEGWLDTASLPVSLAAFVVVKSGSTGNFGYEVGVRPADGQLRFTINGGLGGGDLIGGPNLVDGAPHHFAATYDGSRMLIWIDGVRVGCRIEDEAVSYEAASPLVIGRRPAATPDGDWSGLIDELALYSRALCGEEIRALAVAGSDGKCEGGAVPICEIFGDGLETGTCPWSQTVP